MLGFVDVGGGTRGIYGAGVLDFCMEQGVTGDFFIGVSAGAANGASFLAGQERRNYIFYDNYAFRKEYMGASTFFKTGSYIGLDYIYSDLSGEDGEYPLDYEKFVENPMKFEVVATDALTGMPRYFEKDDLIKNQYDPIKASCCVPVLCKPYVINGIPYFDGGLSDPIPFHRAFEAGCNQVVVILTRPKNSFRKPEVDKKYARILKRHYPMAAKALSNRANTYNQSLRELLELEKEGKAIVIAPADIGHLKTLTQDHKQLEHLYEMGRKDAEIEWKKQRK